MNLYRQASAAWPYTAMLLAVALSAAVTGRAQDPGDRPRTPVSPPANAITEVVPTSRRQQVTWRYTFDRPGEAWAGSGFDDSGWKQGPGGFGTRGTPGFAVGTTWNTPDVWLRRAITLPADGFDPAALQLLVFHDEDVEIYFDGVLAARDTGYITAYEPRDIQPAARALLKPGAKIVLAVHCRQTAGGQGIDVGLATVPPGAAAQAADSRRRDRYRSFAMAQRGDPGAGERLFRDEQRLACSKCHATDGKSGGAGPDLFTAGEKFPRRELIDAILTPSAGIAVGYSTTVVRTRSGAVYHGVVKDAADDGLGLMGADGKLVRIAGDQIALRRTTDLSLMPDGLEAGVTPQEFTDVVEYLVSLKLPASADASRHGMPTNIPELPTPVGLIPFCEERHRFDHPDAFVPLPGASGRFLVCEHESGKVWLLDKSRTEEVKSLFGDFSGEIRRGGATGLLGLAPHPSFRENRKYYIQHQRTLEDGRLYTMVSEKVAAPDGRRDSGRPSRTVISVLCSTDVHSGGGIEFGPDGFLYIGMGDTGPQGDPQGHGQNLSTPLGKMLRIDVDRAEHDKPYGIPADNPLRGASGARPEIWASGFREPWRFSFDPKTADLWVGDVGQDVYEEVAIVRRGENHGWNAFEGFEPFSSRYRKADAVYVPPVFAYPRKYGNSVTGGYVYRGDAGSPFYGHYIFGDYTSRRIWGLSEKDRVLVSIRQIALAPERIASFGRGEDGDLYVVGYEGMIYKLDLGSAAARN